MPQLPSFLKPSNSSNGPESGSIKDHLRKSTSAQHDLRSLLTVASPPLAVGVLPMGNDVPNFRGKMRTSQSEATLSTSPAASQALLKSAGTIKYGSRLHVPEIVLSGPEGERHQAGGMSLWSSSSSVGAMTASAPSKKGALTTARSWLPSIGLTRCRLSHAGSEAKSMLSAALPHSASHCSMAASLKSNYSVASFQTTCKLCLCELPAAAMYELQSCRCTFCRECMEQYIKIQILDGSAKIACPDGQCATKGALSDREIEQLADSDLYSKYRRFKLDTEIDLDKNRTWCPTPGCETVCPVISKWQANAFTCTTCQQTYCSVCKAEWQTGHICEVYSKKKKSAWFLGSNDRIFLEGDDSPIKYCPSCHVPIERDNGCAQMMCKRCKHVFCWYCLASLDDDFLLRHYDKGPCKNKLGHSRASVIWHRTQVIGIFAGFGILLLVASPLLLLAAPCILCCKCKNCDHCNDPTISGGTDGAVNL